MKSFKVKFWGTRGSIPTPGLSTLRYGGNTSCVEVRTPEDGLVIFDCGSGLRELGHSLMHEKRKRLEGHIFLSHTHWDHIQGFPFFTPAFIEGNCFTLYAVRSLERKLEEILALQMEYSYFPVKLKNMGSKLSFCELEEQEIQLGDLKVQTHFLNHTALTLGYRLSWKDRCIVYCTDVEPGSNAFWRKEPGSDKEINPSDLLGIGLVHQEDLGLAEFCRDADILIMDAQYTDDEYPQKMGWGHSTSAFTTKIAAESKAKQLFLYHFDPLHSDEKIDEMLHHCREMASGYSLEIDAAREGLEITLQVD